MTHRARCQCGALSLIGEEPPDFSVVCCCSACQLRTGSAFGVGAYFRKATVKSSGPSRTWTRQADSGRRLTNYFCPTCGTTLFWVFDMRPDHLGVAVGCLEEPIEEPLRAVWTEGAADWLRFPDHWPLHSGPSVE